MATRTEVTSGSIRATITSRGNTELATVHRGGLLGPLGKVEIQRADVGDLIAALLELHGPHGEIASVDVGPKQAASRTRAGVTIPVELEEREAVMLDEMFRNKFTGHMPDGQSILLRKVQDIMRKFADNRIADEELSASLTDEERELIRSRRAAATWTAANMGRKDK